MKRAVLTLLICGSIVVLSVSTGDSQTRAITDNNARECAMCHLDWAESFKQKAAPLLIDKPSNKVMASEEMCFSCHDGSIADSRNTVWRHHGHQVGMTLPADMHVPDALPLDNGQVSCQTCHSAHTGGADTIETINFLRVTDEGGKLCGLCHTDYTEGDTHGSHPLSKLEWDLPTVLAENGAKLAADGSMTCGTCHNAHGESEDHLLVTSDVGDLCIACHEKLDPERYAAGTMANFHPVGVHETEETPDCLSCHQMHRSPTPDHLLNTPLADGGLCGKCHEDQQTIVGTEHDLLKHLPTAMNALGVAAGEGGTCSGCHAVHGQARTPRVTASDPDGMCTTCHSTGQCAEEKALDAHNHAFVFDAKDVPSDNKLALFGVEGGDKKTLACVSCHAVHGTEHDGFLIAKADGICANCHSEQTTSLAGDHAIAQKHPGAKNVKGEKAAESGSCGFCHAMHGSDQPVLWAASSEPITKPEDTCRACHRDGGMSSDKVGGEMRHPMQRPKAGSKAAKLGLPMFDQNCRRGDAGDGSMTCSTCHDVHANSSKHTDLLRGQYADDGWGWCGQCHEQADTLAMSLHGRQFMAERKSALEKAGVVDKGEVGSVTSCGPCHAVHAEPGSPATGMWSGPIAEKVELPGSERCLGCHQQSGGAKAVHVTVHPTLPMASVGVKGDRGYMPLADENGDLGNEGLPTCQTCHVAHGPESNERFPGFDAEKVTRNQLTGMKTNLRPYATPNLCSGCHGFEGIHYYMYYHHPDKRRGLPPIGLSSENKQ